MVVIDWSTVMRDHYSTACRVIERLMPSSLRTTYDPEDFVGDAIVELMANPERLIEKGSTLLILVAKRRMIDAARSPRSRSTRWKLTSSTGNRRPYWNRRLPNCAN